MEQGKVYLHPHRQTQTGSLTGREGARTETRVECDKAEDTAFSTLLKNPELGSSGLFSIFPGMVRALPQRQRILCIP